MRPATFYAFAGLTAAAVVAAAVSVSMRPGTTTVNPGIEPAFPKLAGNVNAVAQIDVQDAKHKFSITRHGEKWGMDQKDGYPVEYDKVKSAIVAAADFKLIEQKTSDPSRYKRLDLEAPDGPDAKSTKVVFKDDKGNVLAAAVIGKLKPSLFGSGGSGTYIRRDGEKATWLVRGEITLGKRPIDWMVKEIVNYGQEKVRKVVIKRPDGSSFSISKAKQSDSNFVVDDIPPGKKMKNPDEANPLGGVTWRLLFDDVKLAKKQNWPKQTYVADYFTWSGLDIHIVTAKIGKDYWGRFHVSVADDVTDPAKKKEAEKTAAKINGLVDGWSYMLTAGDSEKLVSKKGDYLADAKKKGS